MTVRTPNLVRGNEAPAIAEASPRLYARVAGGLYVTVALAGLLALALRSSIIVRGDATATASNIMASETLFRLSIAAEFVAAASYIAVALFLYGAFKPVSRQMSLLAAFFGLTGCIISAVMQLNLLAPLVLLSGAPYLTVFSPEQLQALSLMFTRLYTQGSNISFLFFGSYCLMLGYLVFRSSFLPRTLGALLTIAGLSWLTNSLAILLAPPLASMTTYLSGAAGIGELAFALWLLVRGVDLPHAEKQENLPGASRTPFAQAPRW